MEQRYRTGSGLAVIGGAVLIVFLFLEWFSEEGTCAAETCSAFKTFDALDIVLAGLGIAAILLGLIGLAAPGRAPAFLLTAVGFLATGMVLALLVELGDDLGSSIGIWLSLVGGILAAVGGVIATPSQDMVAAPTVGPGGPPRGKLTPGGVSPGTGAGTPGSAPSAAGMPAPSGAAAAGWYPDPTGAAAQRYWDGSSWTDHTA